jgi:hypothetical protein
MKTRYLMLLVALMSCATALGDDGLLHLAAHVGSSYAINTMAYGACYKGGLLRRLQENPDDNVPCVMLSAFTTLMIGFAYKQFESNVGFPDMARSMSYNALGTALSIGSIYVFKF